MFAIATLSSSRRVLDSRRISVFPVHHVSVNGEWIMKEAGHACQSPRPKKIGSLDTVPLTIFVYSSLPICFATCAAIACAQIKGNVLPTMRS